MQDVGKLLLRTEPVIFNGNTLELVADTPGVPRAVRNGPSAAPPPTTTKGSGMFVPRAAASRPRAGLGSKKRVVAISAAAPASSQTNASPAGSTSGQAKGQDDFRKMLG